MRLEEGMKFPINSFIQSKIKEHSAWYSGDAEILANYYSSKLDKASTHLGVFTEANKNQFWGRNIKNNVEIAVHVPVAGDIADLSSKLLFGEAPNISIEANNILEKATNELIESFKTETSFVRKCAESAETSAALGGVYLKLAWDKELSDYPIIAVEQPDYALPTFTFGYLTNVTFITEFRTDEVSKTDTVYRLGEEYTMKGQIINRLFKGTSATLGFEVSLSSIPETESIQPLIETGIDDILAIYVPNKLPNRYLRSSYQGISDYAGLEGLMDSLDETFSSWVKDLTLAQAKIMMPEEYLTKINSDGSKSMRANMDTSIYVGLDQDPTVEGNKITAVQFDIRAEKFEKTALNLLERIISSAGYSPQSFGLNIEGRAESGTALNIRERKTFLSKVKKEEYWKPQLKRLLNNMIKLYNSKFGGTYEVDNKIKIDFADSITNDMLQTATAIDMLNKAMAISTEQKVKTLHPDWSQEEVKIEVEAIKLENSIGLPMVDNPDSLQINEIKSGNNNI